MQTQEGWQHGRIVVAAFTPARMDTLRPELRALAGEVASWRYSGTGDDGEPYPGQHRWMTDDPRFGCHWVPDEDLTAVG